MGKYSKFIDSPQQDSLSENEKNTFKKEKDGFVEKDREVFIIKEGKRKQLLREQL